MRERCCELTSKDPNSANTGCIPQASSRHLVTLHDPALAIYMWFQNLLRCTGGGWTCNLAAPDAAAPALQHIERTAIAAATQITYAPHELLLLIQVGHKAATTC